MVGKGQERRGAYGRLNVIHWFVLNKTLDQRNSGQVSRRWFDLLLPRNKIDGEVNLRRSTWSRELLITNKPDYKGRERCVWSPTVVEKGLVGGVS